MQQPRHSHKLVYILIMALVILGAYSAIAAASDLPSLPDIASSMSPSPLPDTVETPTPDPAPEATPTEEPAATADESATADPPAAVETPTGTVAIETLTPAPDAESTDSTTAPTVTSDQADYPPGATVTLTGANWQPQGVVTVTVDPVDSTVTDEAGLIWKKTFTPTADAGGGWQVVFNLPTTFVALYKVTAVGPDATGAETTVIYTFTDSVGSYTLKWYAADPAVNSAPYLPTYVKKLPSQVAYPLSGRQSDPMQNAVCYGPTFIPADLDAVTSLMPKDLMLGQVVPFEMEIAVSGSTDPENGTISFKPYWLTKVTNGDDFGFDPNYKVIAAFVDYGDVGTVDPGGDATVDSFTSTILNAGTSNEQIEGNIQVSGLDDGDNVIVEMWVVLKSSIGPSVGGNVQTGLTSASTVPPSTKDISTGNQTVPLLQVGDFYSADADLSITKSDSPDPVVAGQNVTYSITAINTSTDTYANGVVITDTLDPNVSFVSASDGGTAASGLVTWPTIALAPLQSVTRTVTVTVNSTAPSANFDGTTADDRAGTTAFTGFDIQNRVNITAITDDPAPGNNVYYVPTNVLPSTADVSVTKTDNPDIVYLDGSRQLVYTVVVTNNSSVATAKNVVATDTLDPNVTFVSVSPSGSESAGVVTMNVGDLAPSASATYTITVNVQNSPPTSGTGGAGGVFTPPTPPSRTGYDLFNTVVVTSTNDSNASNNGYWQPTDVDTGGYFDLAFTIDKTVDANADGTYHDSETIVVPGGNVWYKVVITNTSLYQDVKIDSLVDEPNGDLGGQLYDAPDGNLVDLSSISLTAGGGSVTLYFSGPVGPTAGTYPDTVTATASQEGNPSNTLTHDDSASVVVVNPHISLTKTADPTTYDAVGDVIAYTLVATNDGDVPLTNVTITEGIALTNVVSNPAQGSTLQPGETMTVTGDYVTTQGDIDTGSKYNMASTAGQYGGLSYTDTAEATITAVQSPALTLVKTGSFDAGLDGYADPGEIISYEFLVTNTGNVTLTGITVTDPLVGLSAISLPKTTLAPGESMTGTATYAVTQTDIDAGSVYNLATADSTESEEDTDDETVPLPQNPALSLVKTGAWVDGDADGYADVGEAINYTFVVTNEGNVTLKNVTVSDTVGGVTITGGPLLILAVGETDSTTFTGVYYITQADIDAGHFYNVATADSDESGPASDDEDVLLPQNPALSLDKTGSFDAGGDGFADPGELITYTFVVTNTGNQTLSNITVSDPKVSDIAYVSGDDGDGLLQVGEAWTYTGSYAVTQVDIDAGSVYNLATADSDESDEATDDETVPLPQNPAAEPRQVTVDGATQGDGLSILTGETIGWKYTVTNTGNVTLTDVAVTDDQGVTVTLPKTTLAPDESMTGTAAGSATTGTYTNTGTASGKPPVGDNVTSSDTSSYFGANPQISIDKVTNGSDGPELLLGDVITWTYTVTNVGNVPLSDVSVTDSVSGVTPVFVSGDGNSDGVLDLTETWVYEAPGIVTVGMLMVGDRYDNTGTAGGSYTDDAGHSRTDTATDDSWFTAYGLLEIEKRTNGGANTLQTWTFQLELYAVDHNGSVVATDSTTPTNGVLDFGGYKLDPTLKYTICELNVPAGWTSVWYYNGNIVSSGTYNPDGSALPPENFGNVCMDIGAGTDFPIPADGLLRFVVDNTYPGGEPRTPGYWKNWSSVSGGGQMQTAYDNGGWQEGYWTLDDLLYNPGFDIGLMRLDGVWNVDPALANYPYLNEVINLNTGLPWANDCVEAVRILGNYDVVLVKGKLVSRANDAAYNLARNLLAARLNLAAGAETGTEITDLVTDAQELLVSVKFNGTGSYLGPKVKGSLLTVRQQAASLASSLDIYNNGSMY